MSVKECHPAMRMPRATTLKDPIHVLVTQDLLVMDLRVMVCHAVSKDSDLFQHVSMHV